MSKPNFEQEMASEFERFKQAPGLVPPEKLSSAVRARVHADLSPSVFYVFSRILLVHLVVGTVTLLFCPQFGLGLYKDVGLMALLMRYGHHVCMIGCGAVFLGSSALIASFVLRPAELLVVRRSELAQFAALGVLSLAVLALAGGEIALVFAASWLFGCVAGASALLEFGAFIRRRFSSGLAA